MHAILVYHGILKQTTKRELKAELHIISLKEYHNVDIQFDPKWSDVLLLI